MKLSKSVDLLPPKPMLHSSTSLKLLRNLCWVKIWLGFVEGKLEMVALNRVKSKTGNRKYLWNSELVGYVSNLIYMLDYPRNEKMSQEVNKNPLLGSNQNEERRELTAHSFETPKISLSNHFPLFRSKTIYRPPLPFANFLDI